MKKTRYYVLTEKKLLKLQPCQVGLDFALQFLPAALSTNPEENIELAERLIEAESWDSGSAHWVEWLRYWACPRLQDDLSGYYMDFGNVYDIAQRLAMIADELAD